MGRQKTHLSGFYIHTISGQNIPKPLIVLSGALSWGLIRGEYNVQNLKLIREHRLWTDLLKIQTRPGFRKQLHSYPRLWHFSREHQSYISQVLWTVFRVWHLQMTKMFSLFWSKKLHFKAKIDSFLYCLGGPICPKTRLFWVCSTWDI